MKYDIEAILSGTLRDISISTEVKHVLQDVLLDIELWDSMNSSRRVQLTNEVNKRIIHQLNKKLAKVENDKLVLTKSLSDIQAKAFSLRDKFVVDISTVLCDSKNIFKLKQRINELHNKVQRMSSLETELLTANDTIRGLEATVNGLKNSRVQNSSSCATTITNGGDDGEGGSVDVNDDGGGEAVGLESLPGILQSPETATTYNSEFSYVGNAINADPSSTDDGSGGGGEVVAINRQVNFLADLEDRLLLHIFTFLTTPEVLHSAQVNRKVFKRVDTLFGIDSQVVKDSHWDDASSSSAPAGAVDSSKGSAAAAASNSTNLMNNIISNIQNNILVQNSQNIFGAIVTNVTARKEHRNSFDGSSGSGTVGSIPAAAAPGTQGGAGGAVVAASLSAISSEISDSLSKKLTSVELKAVVSLADRMNKQQMSVDTLLVEKEDLLARATGAESVRDFLVDKLKNAELAIKAYMGEVAALKKQASADHEVISYLDIKSQELDALSAEMSFKNTQLHSSLELQSNAFVVKEKHLQSQLGEATRKCNEYETTHKSQKKVLVKEVKSLRVQVEQLTSERNRYKVHLKTLRDAVASVDSFSGGSNQTRSLFS